LKWLAIWISEWAAMIWMSGLAQAASEPQAAGQIRPSSRELAPIAAGSAPATAAIDPSKEDVSEAFLRKAGGLAGYLNHCLVRGSPILPAMFLALADDTSL